jgi:hypothetical protein
MTDTELLFKLWPVFVWLVTITAGALVYVLRIEGRVNYIEKTQTTDGTRLANAFDKLSDSQSKMADTISDMRVTLSGIVGYERGREETGKRIRK